MNFAFHVSIFAASNSGLWFFRTLYHADWSWAGLVTVGWALLLGAHGIYVLAIANYSEPSA